MELSNNFIYFTLLPTDIQRKILTEDLDILRQSRKLSTQIHHLVRYEFYNSFKDHLLDEKEIINYLKSIPEVMTMFIWNYNNYEIESIFDLVYATNPITDIPKLLTITLTPYSNSDENMRIYSFDRQQILLRYNSITHRWNQTEKNKILVSTIEYLMNKHDYDLMTKYNIYFSRGCEDVIKNYSKNKI